VHVKALVSGLIVAVASEVAHRSTLLCPVLISLPLMSAVRLCRDTGDVDEVARLWWSIL